MWPVCVVGLVCWEGVGFFVLFTRPRLLLLVGIERKDSDVLPDSPDSLVAVDGRICTERRRTEEREVSSSERGKTFRDDGRVVEEEKIVTERFS